MAKNRDLSALVSRKAEKEQRARKPESQKTGKPAELKKKTFRLPVDMATRFAVLAKQRGVTEEAQLVEALELLFDKYN